MCLELSPINKGIKGTVSEFPLYAYPESRCLYPYYLKLGGSTEFGGNLSNPEGKSNRLRACRQQKGLFLYFWGIDA